MKMDESNITDQEIKTAFENTFFGESNHRKLLEQGVLKRIAGYLNGNTLMMILMELGLTNHKDKVLKKGIKFIYHAFYDKKLRA